MISGSEGRNPNSHEMDSVPTIELLTILNDEDDLVAPAVRKALPDLARAVDMAAERFEEGGSVHYLGAGTSGRIAVQDAAELIPTFGLEPGRVVAHIAGGQDAIWRAVEGAEDDLESALRGISLGALDVVVGLSASGSTPYVAGGLQKARQAGALSILITANPESLLIPVVDVPVIVATGPEVLAGSTRLKAGSAQKMALNSFSTALMTRAGRTWSNLMVSMSTSNQKLRQRAVSVITAITGIEPSRAQSALETCDLDIGVAVIHLSTGLEPQEARELLKNSDGSVRRAMESLKSQ